MIFDNLRQRVEVRETAESVSPIAVQLRGVIERHGYDILRNQEKLAEEITSLAIPPTIKAQLLLALSCSTLPDFIMNAKSDLIMVDADNALHSVVDSTGLSYSCAIPLVADVFYACGLSFSMEYGPVLDDGHIEHKLHALMPSEQLKTELDKTDKAMREYNANPDKGTSESVGEIIGGIRRLCAAGAPEGFYLLGRCYLYGECGTDIDKTKAMELLKLAAARGVPRAAAIMGDIYYQADKFRERDYTLAHHYYTRPGALAAGKPQQAALRDIYAQRSANRTTLWFSGITLLLTLLYTATFYAGFSNGGSRVGVGVLLTALSALAFALAVVMAKLKPFGGIRWVLAVQYFIWALYAFILMWS